MKELRKLIDVKSIVTLVLLATLVFVTATNRPMGDNVFLLFSNVTTMVFTYFFTKKKEGENGKTCKKRVRKNVGRLYSGLQGVW